MSVPSVLYSSYSFYHAESLTTVFSCRSSGAMATTDYPVPAVRGRADSASRQRKLPSGAGLPQDVSARFSDRAEKECGVYVAVGPSALHQVRHKVNIRV